MKATLRAFVTPIPDTALPRLNEHMVSGVRAFSLLMALLTPAIVAALILGEGASPLLLLVIPVQSAAFIGLARLVTRPTLKARVNAFAFAACCAMLLGMTLGIASGSAGTLAYIPMVPIMVASFYPWRPTFSLALLVPIVAAMAVAVEITPVLPLEPTQLAVAVVVAVVLSAGANQVQRHVWLRLEKATLQLMAAERMTSLGRMTAGIAHELKTPIAASLNGVENGRRLVAELEESIGHPEVTDGDRREIAGEIREVLRGLGENLDRTGRFVASVRTHTLAMHQTERVAFDAAAHIDQVTTLLAHRLRRSPVRVDLGGLPRPLELKGDPGKFEQIVTNLLSNALDACEESGQGSVIHVEADQSSEAVVLRFRDDGPGVPPALRRRIFEPLFTTRAAGTGTGLGLSIARDLAEGAFGGRLELRDGERGACFELTCPRRAAVEVGRAEAAWAPAGAMTAAEA